MQNHASRKLHLLENGISYSIICDTVSESMSSVEERLEHALRFLSLLSVDEIMVAYEDISPWRTGGAETYIAVGQLTIQTPYELQERCFVAKAVVTFPTKPIEAVKAWLERFALLFQRLAHDYKGKADLGRTSMEEFDVFLCHNNIDKPAVKLIGEELKQRGIRTWLDEWNLIPGRPWQRALEAQIENIKSAAVFVGESGLGPWTHMELDAFLREFVNRGCSVIPVILPVAKTTPDLPVFLRAMHWVDFRTKDPDPFDQLIWGITGRHV